jgi:hypothetical protein
MHVKIDDFGYPILKHEPVASKQNERAGLNGNEF